MSGFPRGWTLSTQAGGGFGATITVPAAPGIVHVLDSLFARIINTGTGASFIPAVRVTTSLGVVLSQLLVCAATIVTSDEVSFSGLDIPSSAGGTIVIDFNAVGLAGYFETLVVQGHDI